VTCVLWSTLEPTLIVDTLFSPTDQQIFGTDHRIISSVELHCTSWVVRLWFCFVIHLHLVPKLRAFGAVCSLPVTSPWHGTGLSTGASLYLYEYCCRKDLLISTNKAVRMLWSQAVINRVRQTNVEAWGSVCLLQIKPQFFFVSLC